MRLLLFVFLVLSFVNFSRSCDDDQRCDACRDLTLVETAFENKDAIQSFLNTRKCPDWTDFTFNFIAVHYRSLIDCYHVDDLASFVDPDESCAVAEVLSLKIDQKISQIANTAAVDDLTRDGQLECEPDGTMVFNRGKVVFSELDSLFEPSIFMPHAWDENDLSVGFEVTLRAQPDEENELCTRIESVFLVLFDILDSSGGSIVSSPF